MPSIWWVFRATVIASFGVTLGVGMAVVLVDVVRRDAAQEAPPVRIEFAPGLMYPDYKVRTHRET